MSRYKNSIVIVPCSGIGKPFGSVSREAAYELCENLRPNDTQIVSLSKLVLGDNDAQKAVSQNSTITVDGCKQMCASKMVRQSGGKIVQELTVLDVYRRHKELKPEGIAELNESGKQLAYELAKEIADITDEIKRTDEAKGGYYA
jgi:uncharacterized metal-binding protein